MKPFDRRSAILGDLDVGRLKGLEIGPLQDPMVRKSDGFVLYVDHADTEFIKNANRSPLFNNDDICDIDIVWGDRPLRELVPHPMDYVVASHVIEHVPDMIGWLIDLDGALTADGVICLAIPDRRFTFDLRRPESTAGEMIEAFLMRVRRPPARHLFDQIALQAAFPKAEAWEDDMLSQTTPEEKHLATARCMAERVTATTDYVDAHCWVFTPETFLNVAERLSGVGLFPFTIDYFHPTEYGDYVFHVRLRKSSDKARVAESIGDARQALKEWPPEQAYRDMQLVKVYEQKLPEPCYWNLMRELDARRKELDEQRRQFEDEMILLRDQTAYLRDMVGQYENSTSWRLTKPVRWLGGKLKRK